MSRQISSLEESLGVILFHRHARGLILTEQGDILEKAARDIFSQMALIESQISDSKQRPEGPLRITTTSFLASTWITPNMAPLVESYPDLQLVLLLDNRIYNLGMREADAAIRLYKPEQPDLIQLKLAAMNFHIYGSKAYLDKHGKPKTVEELREHRLIAYPEGLPTPFADPNWLFRLSGQEPADNYNMMMMNSMAAIYQSVLSGSGLGMLPDYLMDGRDDMEIILPDITPPSIDMYFVYPEERRNSQRIRIFRDFLQDLVGKTAF